MAINEVKKYRIVSDDGNRLLGIFHDFTSMSMELEQLYREFPEDRYIIDRGEGTEEVQWP